METNVGLRQTVYLHLEALLLLLLVVHLHVVQLWGHLAELVELLLHHEALRCRNLTVTTVEVLRMLALAMTFVGH